MAQRESIRQREHSDQPLWYHEDSKVVRIDDRLGGFEVLKHKDPLRSGRVFQIYSGLRP